MFGFEFIDYLTATKHVGILGHNEKYLNMDSMLYINHHSVSFMSDLIQLRNIKSTLEKHSDLKEHMNTHMK